MFKILALILLLGFKGQAYAGGVTEIKPVMKPAATVEGVPNDGLYKTGDCEITVSTFYRDSNKKVVAGRELSVTKKSKGGKKKTSIKTRKLVSGSKGISDPTAGCCGERGGTLKLTQDGAIASVDFEGGLSCKIPEGSSSLDGQGGRKQDNSYENSNGVLVIEKNI